MTVDSYRPTSAPAWWMPLEWPAWRVVLEPVRREHASMVRRSLTAEIARWLGIGTVADMRDGTLVWANEAAALARGRIAYRYLIFCGGDFAGAIEVRPDAVKGHIGYWLRKRSRGRGTVTLANRLVLPIAFEGLGLKAVDWTADEANESSIRVMMRLGAELVGEYSVSHVYGRKSEVRYRLQRRRYSPDASGPPNLRTLLNPTSVR